MMRNSAIYFLTAILVSQVTWGQQVVNIAPGDDVTTILSTVTESNSIVNFEAGLYKVTPTLDGSNYLFNIPEGTIVRGAGSGLDPETATILDLQYSFSVGFRIGAFDAVVEDLTIMRTTGHIIQAEPTDLITFNNVWLLKCFDELIEITGVLDFNFNHCVFGYDGDELIKAEGGGTSIMRFEQCDFFCSVVNYVEAEAGSELLFLNSIFYTGGGRASDNFENENGLIMVRNSIVFDAVEDTRESEYPHPNDGGMTVIGTNGELTIDDSDIGEDPMYVTPPGMGYAFNSIDLHLREGSPALTVGSTSFDDLGNATGDPTWAGSQGLAPADTPNWAVY